MRLVLALAPILLLAACGGGGGANESVVENVSPVANIAAPQGEDWTEVVSKTEQGGYVVGNPDAPIKVIEYGSRSCPACYAFAVTGYEPLMEQYVSTGRVSYEFREFLIHAQDLGVSLLGRCVPTERFFPMLDQMFIAQPQFNEAAQNLSSDTVQRIQSMPAQQAAAAWVEVLGYLDFVKQRGLTEAKARECLADEAAAAELAEMKVYGAEEMNVTGTPSLYVNGTKVNAITWEQFEPSLRAAGAR